MVSRTAWLLPLFVELGGRGSFDYGTGSTALIYCELDCFSVSRANAHQFWIAAKFPQLFQPAIIIALCFHPTCHASGRMNTQPEVHRNGLGHCYWNTLDIGTHRWLSVSWELLQWANELATAMQALRMSV